MRNSGLITEKVYKLKKMPADTAALIAKTSEEADFKKREEIFAAYREELVAEFRSV